MHAYRQINIRTYTHIRYTLHWKDRMQSGLMRRHNGRCREQVKYGIKRPYLRVDEIRNIMSV